MRKTKEQIEMGKLQVFLAVQSELKSIVEETLAFLIFQPSKVEERVNAITTAILNRFDLVPKNIEYPVTAKEIISEPVELVNLRLINKDRKYELIGKCYDCEIETSKITDSPFEQLYCRECEQPIESEEINIVSEWTK